MSTWALAAQLLDEGEGDDALAKLLRRITVMQGEHEADQLRDKLKGMPLRDVKKFVSLRYMDPKADDLADRMVAGFQGMAVGPYAAPIEPAPPQAGQKRGEAPSDRPDPRKPWAAPLGNKIKGLPTALPPKKNEPEPEQEFGAEEPTERDVDIDQLMGRTRGERPSGFVDPVRMQATKSQQAAAVGATRAKEKESGIVDAQKRLWHFAQKYGPDSPTERGTPRNEAERAHAQRLVDRMAAQYGVPVPETDSNGRPKILSADQLMRRREAEPTAAGKRAPSAVHKPPFRGTYVGQVWRPNGVGQQVTRWFADMATGQMARAKRETNPRLEGDEVVWSGTEWVPAELWLNKVKSGGVQPRMTRTDVPTDAGSLPFSWAKKRQARLD